MKPSPQVEVGAPAPRRLALAPARSGQQRHEFRAAVRSVISLRARTSLRSLRQTMRATVRSSRLGGIVYVGSSQPRRLKWCEVRADGGAVDAEL